MHCPISHLLSIITPLPDLPVFPHSIFYMLLFPVSTKVIDHKAFGFAVSTVWNSVPQSIRLLVLSNVVSKAHLFTFSG